MHWVLPVVAERSDTEPRQLQAFAHIVSPAGAGLAPETAARRMGYIVALDDPLGRPLNEMPTPPPQEITAEDAYLRGRVLYGPGTREDALRAWDVAVQLNPSEAQYWRERGEALHRLKRFEDALATVERALELDPQSSGTWRIRASVLVSQKRFDAALDAVEHAIAIDGHYNAWHTKIMVLRQLGRETDAQVAAGHLREALEEWRRRSRLTTE
jgi:tetratricopeptide (TPR) repeat protein